MRPIRIEIQAFGPYAERQSVSFAELGSSALFLICGPTGAGKSTILDAVCFALYGDTSGRERSGKQMRSDHCPPDTATEVTLDFALGAETYRVTRSPEQERPKKKGDGVTRIPSSAALWKRTGLALDDGEGLLLEEGAGKVTAKIEELFGFKSEQFRQVIMIPQGQFRQLLLSSSVERQKILDALFRTEIYAQIEAILRERTKEITDGLRELNAKKEAVLGGTEATEDTLVDELVTLQDGEVRLRKQAEKLKAEERKAQETLTRMAGEAEKFREQREAAAALDSVLAHAGEIEEKKAELQSARNARSAYDAEEALRGRKAEAETAAAELQSAEKRNLSAANAAEEASARFSRAERDAERLPELRDELLTLQSFRGKLAKLGETKRELSKLREAAGAKRREEETLRNGIERMAKSLEEKRQKLGETEKTAGQAGMLALSLERTERRLKALRELESLAGRIARSGREADTAREREKAAASELERTEREYAELQELRLKGQAAALARTLKSGDPCPVCGSTEHPSPTAAGDELPDEAAFEALKKNLETLRKTAAERRLERENAERSLHGLQAEAEALRKHAADEDGDPETLTTELAGIRAQLDAARRAERDSAAFQKEVATLERELDERKPRLERLENELRKLESDTGGLEALVREREAEIPQTYRDGDALEKAAGMRETEISKRQAALENARKALSAAENERTAAQTGLEHSRKSLRQAEEALGKQESVFSERLAEAGFQDYESYRQAKRKPEAIAALEKEVEEYTRRLEAAKERKTRADSATTGLVEPDIAGAEEVRDDIIRRLEETRDRIAASGARRGEITRRLGELKNLSEKIEELEADYGIFGSLWEAASGKKGKRIPFQRFVLGALLDDVLTAASERLRIMSRGRFRLQRQHEADDLRRSTGLDLEIYDSYTGTARPAATLSGGESFLASLSLALGMADVVQAYSGGVHLDTIFIDEGFGSLDPEALDAAMQALVDLQKAGRLVGIISHVPELRERLDTRLEITSGKNGSSIRLVLP